MRYIAEANLRDGAFDVMVGSYAQNREPRMGRPDPLLFRPLLYLILGTEFTLFGTDFFWWQLVGFGLHLGVLLSLLRLLETIHPGPAAYLATLFFSCLLVCMELAIWHHLHAYLFALILILMALRALWPVFSAEAHSEEPLQFASLCFGIAGFAYEPAALFALIAAVVLFVSRSVGRRTRDTCPAWGPWLLALPFALYVLASAADYHMRDFGAKPAASVAVSASSVSVSGVLGQTICAVGWWTLAAFLGPSMGFGAKHRVQILSGRPLDLGRMISEPSFWVLSVTSLCLALVALSLLRPRLTWQRARSRWEFPTAVSLMIAAFATLISAGRFSEHGLEWMAFHPYYSYPFWLLLIVALYSCVDFETPGLDRRPLQRCAALGLAGIVILANGLSVLELSWTMAGNALPECELARTIRTLTAAHRDEPDFSIFVPLACPGNYPVDWLRRKGDPPEHLITYAEILAGKVYRTGDPKYVLFNPMFPVLRPPHWGFPGPRRRVERPASPGL